MKFYHHVKLKPNNKSSHSFNQYEEMRKPTEEKMRERERKKFNKKIEH